MGSVVISGATSGAITLAVPAEAGTHTVTIPSGTGQLLNSGDLSSAGDTAAGNAAAVGYTAAEGLILTGQGSTSDVTIKNDADATVFYVPTGTSDAFFKGGVYLTPTNGSTSSCVIELGANRTGNGYCYIDLAGDTTYSDFGLRLLRGPSGANATSLISHRGTGALELLCNEAAPMTFGNHGAEKARLSGNSLFLGTTTNTANTTLVVQGNNGVNSCIGTQTNHAGANAAMYFINSNGIVGSIVTASSATSFNTSSDYRLKENVDYSWDATTRLKQLKPARFNFIADESDTLVDGFIAHEVSSIVPEAITGEKDGMKPEVLYIEGDELPDGKSIGDVKEASAPDYQGIDQSKLVPLLVKTIQELEARITALEAS